MNKFYLWFVLLPLMLQSCSNDVDKTQPGEGAIYVSLDATNGTQDDSSRALSASSPVPDVNDFALELRNSKGELVKAWKKFSDFVPLTVLVDKYEVSAFYGDRNKEGFNALSYYGSKEVQVREHRKTETSVVCTIDKALVSISYTDGFKKYFSDYSAYIETSVKGSKVEYGKEEERPAYFVPGDLKLFLKVKRNGVDGEVTLNPKNFNAKARTEYKISMDVDASTATLKIIFDDNTDKTQYFDVNISDAALSAEPPVVIPLGFENGVAVEPLEGAPYGGELRVLVNAQAGLLDCAMETESGYLKTKFSWPDSLNFVSLTQEQESMLRKNKLEWKGFGANKDKMAVVDFSAFVSTLPYTGGEDEVHTFTFVVKDSLTKVSSPMVLKIRPRDNKFSFSGPKLVPYLSKEVEFDLVLDGDYKAVKFHEWVDGSYVEIDSSRIEINKVEDKKYKVKVKYENPLVDTQIGMEIKATIGIESRGVAFRVDAPALTLSLKNGDADVWATKAYLQVTASAKTRASRTISGETVEIQYENGDDWVKWDKQSFDEETGLFKLTGLDGDEEENEGVDYNLRAVYRMKVGGEISSISNELQIKTEPKAQIPNCGFEEWTTLEHDFIYEYYKLFEGYVQVHHPINWDLPYLNGQDAWWAVNSKKTMPTLTNVVSANWNWVRFPTVSYTNDKYTGEKAAILYTVNVGDWVVESALVGEKVSGELFIGTADDSGNHSSDGHSFESRPDKFRFAYKYDAQGNEKFSVTLSLIADDGSEIFSEVKEIGENLSWGEYEIPINYTDKTKKVNWIKVQFKASTAEKPGVTGNYVLTLRNGEKYTGNFGSMLYIDDVTLIYE